MKSRHRMGRPSFIETLHLIQTEIEYDSNESKSRKYHAPKRMRSINHSLPGNEMCTGCSPSYPIHYMPIINPKWSVQTRECKILLHWGVWPVELGESHRSKRWRRGGKRTLWKRKWGASGREVGRIKIMLAAKGARSTMKEKAALQLNQSQQISKQPKHWRSEPKPPPTKAKIDPAQKKYTTWKNTRLTQSI